MPVTVSSIFGLSMDRLNIYMNCIYLQFLSEPHGCAIGPNVTCPTLPKSGPGTYVFIKILMKMNILAVLKTLFFDSERNLRTVSSDVDLEKHQRSAVLQCILKVSIWDSMKLGVQLCNVEYNCTVLQ